MLSTTVLSLRSALNVAPKNPFSRAHRVVLVKVRRAGVIKCDGLRFKSTVSQKSSHHELKKAENWKCRQDLATAYRGANYYGLNMSVCNHLMMKAPSQDGAGRVLLVVPHGMHWSEVTPSSLLGVDKECNIVEGQGKIQLEAAYIHMEVHNARPDILCSFHTHSVYATALGLLEEQVFKMYNQTDCLFYNDFAYDAEYGGVGQSMDEGNRIAKQLGNKSLLLMCNHGVLVVDSTVAKAFNRLYFIEESCKLQMIAMATGKKLRELPDDVSKLTHKQLITVNDEYSTLFLEGMKRILLKQDPGFLDR